MNFLLGAIFVQFIGLIFAHNLHSADVKVITGANFDSEVLKNEAPVMLKFYAPWCGHCKKMVSAYNAFAKDMKDLIVVASIDCTQPHNASLCGKYAEQGYPTLKFFVTQEQNGKKKKVVIDYNNGRNKTEMTNFVKFHMNEFVFRVSGQQQKSSSKWLVDWENFFLKGGNLPKLLLFRPDSSEPTSLLFRALSIKYHYKIVVGEVSSSSDADLAAKLNLPSDKTSLVFFPSGNPYNFILYDGKISRSEIFDFLNRQLETKTEESKVDL